MAALERAGVLVERSTVEAAEPMRIVWQRAWHPVEQDAETLAVASIEQRGEVLRRAEAAGRREQSGRLITPRAVEWMLGDRHQLHMGKAHVCGVRRKLLGQLAIGEPAMALLGPAPPGAEMYLVDRHRRVACVGG